MDRYKLCFSKFVQFVPSNFLCELAAISVAIDIGMDLQLPCFCVHSDSAASLSFLKSSFTALRFTHPIVFEIGWKIFCSSRMDVAITLAWVPGHRGISGNEIADELASRSFSSRSDCVAMPLMPRDLRPLVASTCNSEWNDLWVTSEKGRTLFAIQPTVVAPKSLLSLSRLSAGLLSRLRTGHCKLRCHAYVLRWSTTPLCHCGLAEETVFHFLFDCPLWAVPRASLLARLEHRKDLVVALGSTVSNLRAVLSFCKAAGRPI